MPAEEVGQQAAQWRTSASQKAESCERFGHHARARLWRVEVAHEAARALLLPLSAAVVTNMTSKLVGAYVAGGMRFLVRVAPAVIAISAVFAIVLSLG